MDLAIGVIFLAVSGYYWYVHFRFWKLLKSEAPEVYKKHSNFSPIRYVGGFAWLDYALQRKYLELKNNRITDAGELLCRVHLGLGTFVGYCLLAIAFGGVAWLIYSLVV